MDKLRALNLFDEYNFTQKCINIISSEIGDVIFKHDRFGIFFDNSEKSLTLSELYTDKSFSEITDLTAKTYAGKNVAVCWSGGIDSSLIIASLYKHKIDFKVTVMHTRCKFENPDMYDWVLKNCDVIVLDERSSFKNLYDHVKNGGSVVSGDPADQLFPSIRYNLLPGVNTLKNLYSRKNSYSEYSHLLNQSYPDEYFYNNIENTIFYMCKLLGKKFVLPKQLSTDIFIFIKERLSKNNLDINHFYQLKWLTKFIFKYDGNINRLKHIIKITFDGYKMHPVDFVQYDFFDTLEYQAWAWTNLDRNFELYSKTALTYKWEAKEYIRDVTGLESQLNLVKIPSL
jgi:hypothetical protein